MNNLNKHVLEGESYPQAAERLGLEISVVEQDFLQKGIPCDDPNCPECYPAVRALEDAKFRHQIYLGMK